MIYGLAVLGVFFVYRWWALLPAIAPVAVTVYIYTMTDYVDPWQSESIGSPVGPIGYAFVLIVGILFQAAFLALGLLLRAAWEWWIRSGRRGSSLPDSA